MEDNKKLSKSETVRAIGSSLRFAIGSSPAFLGLIAIEETISRLVPFANAWILAQLVSTLPHVVHNPSVQQQAIKYVILLAAMSTIPTILDSFGNVYRAKQRIELDLRIKKRLQTAFAFLPFAMYEDKRIMDAYDRADRFAGHLSQFILYRLRTMFGSLVALVVATVAFWHFSPWLTLLVFALTAPMFWIELHLQRLREQIWRNNTLNYRKADAYADMARPRMIKESRLLGLVSMAIDKSQHYTRTAETAQVAIHRKSEKYHVAGMLLGSIIEVIVLLKALQQIVAGKMPIGQFVFVQQIASQYLGALREVTWQVQDLDDLLFGVSEYTEITNFQPEARGVAVKNPNGDIEAKDVSFQYPGSSAWALKDVSVRIPGGQTIAIVGENGAGKTTLVKLLMKLYTPSKGSITIDGQALQEIGSETWHQHMGVLFQDFQTFYNFTLRENVWFGNKNADPKSAALTSALKAADAWEYANELPKGIETYLGKYIDEENGTDLSGGQSQRLAIARTLFRNPDLLVLDEPTSAIDAKAEYKIFKAIDTSRKGRTTILISHRFSTVRKAQYIYVMEKGRLKEQGTHEELMEQQGLYHEMFTKQAEGYR